MFYRKAVLEKFTKFTGKHRRLTACDFTNKRTPLQNLKKRIFTEHLLATTSVTRSTMLIETLLLISVVYTHKITKFCACISLITKECW